MPHTKGKRASLEIGGQSVPRRNQFQHKLPHLLRDSSSDTDVASNLSRTLRSTTSCCMSKVAKASRRVRLVSNVSRTRACEAFKELMDLGIDQACGLLAVRLRYAGWPLDQQRLPWRLEGCRPQRVSSPIRPSSLRCLTIISSCMCRRDVLSLLPPSPA
jgi:hypothetical protein